MKATWGNWYWPLWFGCFLASLLIPEIYALSTNVENTLSYWVWRELEVSPVATTPWTAAHFLMFGLWIVNNSWLTVHFFWRKLT